MPSSRKCICKWRVTERDLFAFVSPTWFASRNNCLSDQVRCYFQAERSGTSAHLGNSGSYIWGTFGQYRIEPCWKGREGSELFPRIWPWFCNHGSHWRCSQISRREMSISVWPPALSGPACCVTLQRLSLPWGLFSSSVGGKFLWSCSSELSDVFICFKKVFLSLFF